VFIDHYGWQNCSDQGIGSAVVESPSIKNQFGMINAQCTEVVIRYSRYLIGPTREVNNALSLDPIGPLPL